MGGGSEKARATPGLQNTTPSAGSSEITTRDDHSDRAAKRRRTKKKRITEMVEGTTWPWTASLPMTEYESKDQRLHDEIVAYATYISPTEQEQRARELVIARIAEVIRKRFSNVTVATFGSTAQNLYLPDGDVDLVMSLPRELDLEGKKRTLFQLSSALRNSLITRNVQVVHRARVPVVSFDTLPELGSFKVDIGINSTDGVKAVPIIAEYLKKMPALRYLVLAVKGHLSRLELNSASDGGLSSYSVICLVINFLQINPKDHPEEDIQKPLERESLGRLLIGFYEYYGHIYDYENSCVSVAQGKVVTKESKGWENPSQPELFSIECLVNPEHDVGKPTGRVKQVRTALREAYTALQCYPFSMAHNNALGTIIGVSPDTAGHREQLKEIVDSGSLEQALSKVKLPEYHPIPRHPPQISPARTRDTRHQPYPRQNAAAPTYTYMHSQRSHADHRGQPTYNGYGDPRGYGSATHDSGYATYYAAGAGYGPPAYYDNRAYYATPPPVQANNSAYGYGYGYGYGYSASTYDRDGRSTKRRYF